MRCVIYIRVSTDEQANEGFSIEAQKRRLLAYAESQGWIVVDIYVDDGFSAKDMERPEMKRMLKNLSEFDVLLTYKLDRLTRSASDCDYLLKLLDRNNVTFQSATESFETRTATGRLFVRLVADIAQWERENTAERVRMGMEQMIVEGKRPGGVIPYGYTKDEQLIQEEVELIKEVRNLYMSGMGYKAIAVRLNQRGLLRRGKEWSQSTVSYTLENPYYAGIIRFGTKNKLGKYVNTKRDDRVKCLYGDGTHPIVFSKYEYEEHCDLIKRKSNSGFSQIKDYWFSGILKCGRCGSAMFGRLTVGKNKNGPKRSQYYICSKRHDGRSCDMPTIRQVHVEHLVMEYLKGLNVRPIDAVVEMERIAAEQEKLTSEADVLKNDLQRVKERRKKWQYMFVEELITSEELKERIATEATEEENINKRLSEISSVKSPIDEKYIDELMDIWEVTDSNDKKAIAYNIFERIVINTDLNNVKGVKNKFFDARIEEMAFN